MSPGVRPAGRVRQCQCHPVTEITSLMLFPQPISSDTFCCSCWMPCAATSSDSVSDLCPHGPGQTDPCSSSASARGCSAVSLIDQHSQGEHRQIQQCLRCCSRGQRSSRSSLNCGFTRAVPRTDLHLPWRALGVTAVSLSPAA